MASRTDTVAADTVADTGPTPRPPLVPSPPTGPAVSPRQRHAARVPVVRAQLAAAERRVARITPALKSLQAGGAVTRFEPIPAASVIVFQGTAAAAAALAAEPAVAAVVANRELRLSDPTSARAGPASRPLGWNLVEVGADRAWRALGATGEGVVIATIDSGADWTHPALLARYRGRLGDHDYNWFDATDVPSRVPIDPHGHGTQVLGVAVGRAGAITYGVAPGADWIAVRAFDAQGRATDASLLRAGAWLLAPTDREGRNPRPDLAPDIVNGSWALGNGADPLYDELLVAWRAAGILPVFAAGNVEVAEGTTGRIRAPAAAPGAAAVGASLPGGAPWSRSAAGPAFSGAPKPDLLAPGSGIMAPVPGGGEAPADGTSMAAPHVSGAAALVLSLAPDLPPADIESFVRHAARDRGAPGVDPVYGWGDLNAGAAAAAAVVAGRLRGTVRAADGQPVGGATVRASTAAASPPWATVTDGDGVMVAGGAGRPLDGGGGGLRRRCAAAGGECRGRWGTQVDLVLAPMATGRVAGRLSSARGAALPAARWRWSAARRLPSRAKPTPWICRSANTCCGSRPRASRR